MGTVGDAYDNAMAGSFLVASKLNSPCEGVNSRPDIRRGVNNFTGRDRYNFSCSDGRLEGGFLVAL